MKDNRCGDIRDQGVLKRIQAITGYTRYIPLQTGYSSDQKWIFSGSYGKRYLVRISPEKDTASVTAREEELRVIERLHALSPLVPEPVAILRCPGDRSCVMILEYIEGTDGEQALPQMTPKDSYHAGFQAGQALSRLHLLAAPKDAECWSVRKREKHARYCSAFNEDPCNPGYDLRPVHEFIGKNLHLMDAVAGTFLHDDFHPANLIFSQGSLTGIIDFGRYEWGDPIHDFCKMAFFTRDVSTAFACGQVAGYFSGNVPPEFWQRYALYTAISMISDLVWSARYERASGKGELQKAITRTRQVYEDHQGFQNVIPAWYEEGKP